MKSTVVLPKGQEWLLKKILDVKQMEESQRKHVQKGVCHGVAGKVIDNFLAGRLISFSEQLRTIHQTDDLSKKIRKSLFKKDFLTSLAKKFPEKTSVISKFHSPKDDELIKINRAFHDILITQSPYLAPNLFNQPQHTIKQNILLTYPHASSELLSQKKEIKEAIHIFKNYNRADLIKYVISMRQAFERSQASTILCFELFSYNHSIVVIYNEEYKLWLLIDANQLPGLPIVSDIEMATQISLAFLFKRDDQAKIAINTRGYCIKHPEVEQKVESFKLAWFNHKWFKEIHKMTPENVNELESVKKGDLLNFAIIRDAPIEYVKHLLALGVDPNRYFEGHTPLINAIIANNVELVNILSGHKSPIKTDLELPYYSVSPIYLAVKFNLLEIVKILVKNGANVNPVSNVGTPLSYAASNNYVEIAKFLLKSGAQVNQANPAGLTPLYVACEEGHLEMANLLLENGANPHIPFKQQLTLLLQFAFNRSINPDEMKKFLWMKQVLQDTTDPLIPITPKEIASLLGHTQVLESLEGKRGVKRKFFFEEPQSSSDFSFISEEYQTLELPSP